MGVERVSELSDPRLDVYCRLTSHQLRNKIDPERGVLVAESEIAIRVALAHGIEPISLLLDEGRLESMGDVVSALSDEVPVFVMPHDLASELTGYRVTRGALAAMRRPVEPDAADLLRDARSVRVSMGNVFLVPWAHLAAPWPEASLSQLHEAGFTCAALALSDDSVSLSDPALKDVDRLAMLFGTEGDGLTRQAIEGCDVTVRIPMSHGVDSLNVAAASAVTFWELCRHDS